MNLSGLNFRFAKLCDANLVGTNLSGADLSGSDLQRANLSETTLEETNLTGANLGEANLTYARLIRANLSRSTIDGSLVYGISVWDTNLTNASQKGLIIANAPGSPMITVDNIEVAQFLHLLLYNDKIRNVIDSITSKVVLILGRFTAERKSVLDAIREALRSRDYLPVLFDFDKPASRDITETVTILAHMARFIIADITDAKSIPQELQAFVPDLPSVPVQPILQLGSAEYGMFEHFKRYPHVLEVFNYQDTVHAITSMETLIIAPAERRANEMRFPVSERLPRG
jgi:hypothetical protein